MKTFTTFFLFSILIFSGANAQEKEYLITKNNDTVYGKIIRSPKLLDPTKIRLKIEDENGDKEIIDPASVKQVRSFRGVYGDCIIKPVYGQWFAKRIIKGKIEVYEMLDEVIFYTSKNGSELEFKDFG
ncbi:hypothetical protein GCM10023115_32230 [Pontixanthobacter gangjinensis]|uniref:Uncharacterized protein n=1 Tax=Christiangramia aestuarii TaxID=1028746 RepID=A0A7K1LNY3_9FLAO|nr:hypothetical protein [Christiangramia aestuarii]MUP42453.1 hypothetical protein [Christiangramia aestuarii]